MNLSWTCYFVTAIGDAPQTMERANGTSTILFPSKWTHDWRRLTLDGQVVGFISILMKCGLPGFKSVYALIGQLPV